MLTKSDKCFFGAILTSLIMNGTCDIQQGPECSKYLWDLKAPRPKPPFQIPEFPNFNKTVLTPVF